jgi:hypothetical protein
MKHLRPLVSAAALTSLIAVSLLGPAVATAAPAAQISTQSSARTSASAAADATDTARADEPEVLASGLRGALGSTIGPDGALYVTEAIPGEITRIDLRTGDTSTYASGLPKRFAEGAGGAMDIAFRGHTAYVLVSVVGPDVGGTAVHGIYRMDDADSWTIIADLGQHALDHPPTRTFDYFVTRGVQFALQAVRGGFLVTDGHLNRVLHVSTDGDIRQVVDFPNVVPTGIESSHGRIYVALAGPVPHRPEDGRIVRIGHRGDTVRDVASGYSLLIDVEMGRCGLYALSQGDFEAGQPEGSPAKPGTGELLRVQRDGTLRLVSGSLDRPSSLELVRNSAFVVTLADEVLRIDNVWPGGRGDASTQGYGHGYGCGHGRR